MRNPLPREVYLSRSEARDEDIRGPYFRDQTAIIHSMAFRRLKHKTQAFFSPENDHVCTRIEHVMHVATIAATICKGLKRGGWELDVELALAIGLGHDIGHAPFGHAGEKALDRKLGKEGAFIHEINGYRVVRYLANDGRGLNLTYGVNDGIICHNGERFEKSLRPAPVKNDLEAISDRSCRPSSYEGCIVRFSDKIAYLGRDIEDAILAGLIKIEDIPSTVRKELGERNGEIINTLVVDIIQNSLSKEAVGFSDEKHEIILELKNFNYDRIYKHERLMRYTDYCEKIVAALFDHLGDLHSSLGHDYAKYEIRPLRLDRAFGKYLRKTEELYEREGFTPNVIVTDYIAGMTDNYALECMKEITFPEPLEFG